MTSSESVDVVVVGGGPAGLSGALTLARARRTVVVLDDGHPRNASAAGAHGFLSRDGIGPTELLAIGTKEVERYGARIVSTRAVAARADADGFTVRTREGGTCHARRLLIATGLTDKLPEIPGLRERWGHDVLHCPYCHGWEVRDQHLGVIGSGPGAYHSVSLFRQWSDRITFFGHTGPGPGDEQREQFAALGVEIVAGEIERLDIAGNRLRGVRLLGGTIVDLDAIVVAPRFVANSDILSGLRLSATDHPWGIGTHIPAGPGGTTSVPGVWAAGNITDPTAGVVQAAAAGVTAAAGINMDLITHDHERRLQRHRARTHSGR
ncbi:NAD(P)/FAD-dependent oxidoreductase [Amycolatopsis pigmentata]|uniref:NAD(P)/FAD-dependent oxidoreductase n=1 Tax=Amycolatopsis pigmentata TaxID=450801 RepID=A0ABW5FL43_9PSEU